jgi:predicted PurR-regulated permease PerM
MYFTAEVLKPLALSILLSFALSPVVRRLERARLPRVVAVVSTVLIALGLLGGFGYVIGQQLTGLAKGLPGYQKNIEKKLSTIYKPGEQSTQTKIQDMLRQVEAKLEQSPKRDAESDEPTPPQRVAVVQQPSIQDRLRSSIGPYLEFLGVASFVLVLVLFMLMTREDLCDRIVALFGPRHASLTTKTMSEIGLRISRYLASFALVNSGFGLVIGTGLALIGVPYAVLWGCLAAMLRFIPYVGPAIAFVMPLVFSFAYFEGWAQPLEVCALFGVVEVSLNSFLEPMIYGRTTGVTALGLLVAALFWTWLWGTLGLLLSTPMTVSLAVLGKYVPSLRFFAIMLGEESALSADAKLYQRILLLDRDGAREVVDAALKAHPRVEVFDSVLIPVLARADQDAARGELDELEQTFLWNFVSEVLDELEDVRDFDLSAARMASVPSETSASSADADTATKLVVVGIAVRDTSDGLVLRMLGQLVAPAGVSMEILEETDSPLEVAERLPDLNPSLVVVSQVSPEGLTLGRYMVRRIRAQFADLPIVLGRWGHPAPPSPTMERLIALGASQIVFKLADARELIFGMAHPDLRAKAETSPLPA